MSTRSVTITSVSQVVKKNFIDNLNKKKMPISQFFSRRPPIIFKAGRGLYFAFFGTRATVGLHPGINLQKRKLISEVSLKVQFGLDEIAPDQLQGVGIYNFFSLGHHDGPTLRSENYGVFYTFGKMNEQFFNRLGGRVLINNVPVLNAIGNDGIKTGFLEASYYTKEKHAVDWRPSNLLIGISGAPSKSKWWLTEEFIPGLVIKPGKIASEFSSFDEGAN